MEKRCNLVFEAILQYCIKWLEIESNAGLMALDGAEDVYCTILYNDESHTYEQVENSDFVAIIFALWYITLL